MTSYAEARSVKPKWLQPQTHAAEAGGHSERWQAVAATRRGCVTAIRNSSPLQRPHLKNSCSTEKLPQCKVENHFISQTPRTCELLMDCPSGKSLPGPLPKRRLRSGENFNVVLMEVLFQTLPDHTSRAGVWCKLETLTLKTGCHSRF